MASIERTAYPRFKRYYTLNELREIYTPTPSEKALALANSAGQRNYFNFIVLLKTFQRLGYFPKLSSIPVPIVNYIRDSLNLPEEMDLGYDQSRTLYRHRKAIRSYLKVTSFDAQARHLITETVYQTAPVMDNPADLINVAVEILVKDHYELPGFNTLDRLVCRIRHLVNQKLFSQVIGQLDSEFIHRLDQLLESHRLEWRSSYHNLKKLPKKSSRNHLNDLLIHLTWLESFGDVFPYLKGINPTKIQHFAAEAKSLDAAEVKKIAQPKRMTLLLLLWRFYKSHRSAFFRLVQALNLESTSTDERLITALRFLQDNSHRRGQWLPSLVDMNWASPQWQKLVLVRQGEALKLSRRHFEVCVFSYVADELKSGDICVMGSSDYADYREQLLSWEQCQPLMDEYCQNLGFPNNADGFVAHLKSWLEETALKVDEGYPHNTQIVINEQGEPLLKRPPTKKETTSVKVLEALIEERMPHRNLIDILKNVDYWTNFTRHFGPLSGSDPKLERATERYLLTVFAYGCNLGPSQAARHMGEVVTAHMLSFVNRRHISLSKLNAALVDIINRYHVLDLPRLWGEGKSAAADGTKYDLYEQNLLSEYHIRYGGYGGIAYHHVADSYVALFSHFIACGTWEAVYIIEGLLKNSSDIQPDTIHGDTQGQSTPVFALSYLLGIKLMPRIRNWKDLTFYRPDPETVYQHIDSLFSETINWELIRTHWQDLFRVVLSIQEEKISSAVLLRKLGNYSRKNRLYKAFQELGRVVRTVFLLNYISDQELQQQITAATNKVESYNGFSKWLFFGGEGIIANNDPEEQEKIIKYNTLVANAVIFHNAVDLTEVLQQLKREGYLIVREDLEALSPYLTKQIKRFGDYLIDMNALPRALDEVNTMLL